LLGFGQSTTNVEGSPGPFLPLTTIGIPDTDKRLVRHLAQGALAKRDTSPSCRSVPDRPAVSFFDSLIAAIDCEDD